MLEGCWIDFDPVLHAERVRAARTTSIRYVPLHKVLLVLLEEIQVHRTEEQ